MWKLFVFYYYLKLFAKKSGFPIELIQNSKQ